MVDSSIRPAYNYRYRFFGDLQVYRQGKLVGAKLSFACLAVNVPRLAASALLRCPEICWVSVDVDVDAIESAGWLLLDVGDYLREPVMHTPVEKAVRTALRSKIVRQLRKQEQVGDPLDVVGYVRDMLARERGRV